jgi:hypothetical protein
MKPRNIDCDWEFEPLGIHTSANFTLHAWGDHSNKEGDRGEEKEVMTQNQFCLTSSCTKVNNTPQFDCDSCLPKDGDSDIHQFSPTGYSLELSFDASLEDYQIYHDHCLDTDIDQDCAEFEIDSEDSLSWLHTYEDAMEEEIQKQRKRSVQFNETPMIQIYERHLVEDHKNLYYTAHELQHMIDAFVKQGGTSLFRSNVMADDDDDH